MYRRVLLMGILNVTPDSFYDGGEYADPDTACERALFLAREGADIIDIGGESTRPGSRPVDAETEQKRIIPVLERLKGKITVPISVDTRKAAVAKKAVLCGASWINDISGLRDDPEMAKTAAEHGVKAVIMHMKGSPKDMQDNPFYEDVIDEIKDFFEERILKAEEAGIKRENIVLDPGLGFGKRPEDNLIILDNLDEFKMFGLPVMAGPSRKSFIGKILDNRPEERLLGTAAAVASAVVRGADIIRVHDVAEMKEVIRVVEAVVNRGVACRL